MRQHAESRPVQDVSSVMPDLCELCALKIDMAVAKLRTEFGDNNLRDRREYSN